jgi:hypothetical protein
MAKEEGQPRRDPARRSKERDRKRAEYGKRYREEQRAERAEYTKRYRVEHVEQIAEYRRRYREQNLERLRAANREYMRRKAVEPRIAEERRARKAAYSRERYHADIEASRAKARERNAQRRAADPEGYREDKRRRKQAWRDRNRDDINARLRERNRIDPSKKQAAAQRYYERHAEERRAYSRRYHQEHREQQLAKQGQWRQRERRRIEAGLPVRRLHRTTAAERVENAAAAEAFFARPLTVELRGRLEAELRTPPELVEAWQRDVARIRAAQYARENPETSSYTVTRNQAEEARMDAIARQINQRLRITPPRRERPPIHQPMPSLDQGGLGL